MGCTSSASNMASPQVDSEKSVKHSEVNENSMEEADEVIYTDKENETNAINVLPSCDTLGDPTQLARNNKSFIETPSLDLEKEPNVNGHIAESDEKMAVDSITIDNKEAFDNIHSEDKLSTLGEVVEKVVEKLAVDNALENMQNESNNIADMNDNVTKEVIDDKAADTQNLEIESNEQKEEHLNDIASPSQSESSRATRWEALADIAAELPPSLTVDPTTGQIYTLSK